MIRLACLAAAIILAGCAPTREELALADTQTCADYGIPAGHPDHGFCRMVLDQQRAEAEAARQAAVSGNPGLAIAGAALLQQAIAPAPTWTPQGFNCTPITGGGMACR